MNDCLRLMYLSASAAKDPRSVAEDKIGSGTSSDPAIIVRDVAPEVENAIVFLRRPDAEAA